MATPPWDDLNRLARNYWWSWDAPATRLFRGLDPDVWEASQHSPIAILDTLGAEGVGRRLDELDLRRHVAEIMSRFDAYLAGAAASDSSDLGLGSAGGRCAYFCAEYGVHESLPIYAGGLGVLAGDHLKSASDLNLPMVGVGLLYREGYFTQLIDQRGRQRAYYRRNDMERMGLELVADDAGRVLQLPLSDGESEHSVGLWRATIGRIDLYLLDAGLWHTRAAEREPTQRLYGGTSDLRLRQEILLGIGGARALALLGIEPAVYHMNEGHTAFLTLELLRLEMAAGKSFDQAMAAVRERCVFTTHTPVPAGHDRFEPELVERRLGWLRQEMGLSQHDFLGLGRVNPHDMHELFCMTVLALKMARTANGVSGLHGEVTRRMWQGLWPGRRVEDVPIGHVTNGVHIPTWIAPEMADLLDSQLGDEWRRRPWEKAAWAGVDEIPDSLLWAVHLLLKRRLLAYVRKVVVNMPFHKRLVDAHGSDRVLSPDVLTLGFARRFATYKRGDLLFRDLLRARQILANPERPIQVLFSGKAHPQDPGGADIIREVIRATGDPVLNGHVVFLPDYDINVARHLVQGVDVWLNTPRRPREASGTSGQKAPLNGVINASTQDGWWPEGFDGTNGWNIGDSIDHHSEWEQDQRDQHALYHVLEHDMAPLYYEKDPEGIPHRWIARMKASLKTIAPRFNSDRMLREYVQTAYWPRIP